MVTKNTLHKVWAPKGATAVEDSGRVQAGKSRRRSGVKAHSSGTYRSSALIIAFSGSVSVLSSITVVTVRRSQPKRTLSMQAIVSNFASNMFFARSGQNVQEIGRKTIVVQVYHAFLKLTIIAMPLCHRMLDIHIPFAPVLSCVHKGYTLAEFSADHSRLALDHLHQHVIHRASYA